MAPRVHYRRNFPGRIHVRMKISFLMLLLIFCLPQLLFAETKPMVAAGAYHTVGLKSDGTVVAVGDNSKGQLNVGSCCLRGLITR